MVKPDTLFPSSGRKISSQKPSGSEAGAWVIPGPEDWEIWQPGPSGQWETVGRMDEESTSLPDVVVALPATLVTCQLFWLETTDEKAVPDLVRMQCERRLLLRQEEVWTWRILRREADRSLVQVAILQNTIPPGIEIGGAACYEIHARCLDLPPRAVCLWRSLGSLSLALTDETGVVYFQSLPHRDLTREAQRDVRTILLLARAQNWVADAEVLVLPGERMPDDAAEWESALGLKVEGRDLAKWSSPAVSMELVPRSVTQMRVTRRRHHRLKLGALALAAGYLLFVAWQATMFLLTSGANARLQSKLDAVMPAVREMQTTARRLDALNPALDVRTYPLEVLYRAMSVLPEKGVRLTRFDIVGDRLEVGGESSTAREAFDYINALETAEPLNHIVWDQAPQPVPLPNDTTRFSIRGTITGAYRDPEES